MNFREEYEKYWRITLTFLQYEQKKYLSMSSFRLILKLEIIYV